ncbi:hypothetical protein PybrP1_001219 [[Pythium] brassicae (nom. inval.)]|nr:hypothetical protein PybrP1_001219 [[Pythium] brassicae (nom. inval.)]
MSLLAITKKAAPRAAAAATARATRATSTAATQTYSERQAALGRPVSPHVEIYAFPVTALSSITNRATGVALTIGFAGGAALAAVGADVPSLIYAAQDTIPGFAPASKLLVAFPLTYHMLNGVRHGVWDKAPQLINNIDGPKSSYAVIGASLVLSLGAALYTIKPPAEEKSAA